MHAAHHRSFGGPWLAALICRTPQTFVALLLCLGLVGGVCASRLTINSNQLDLINQDLREVKDVKRIIDMVGGSGHLMLALRSDSETQMKRTADRLADLLAQDTARVRAVTYRMPVEFIQDNIGLFVATADLQTFRQRMTVYLKKLMRQNNPFFVRLKDPESQTKPSLQIQDLLDKYSHVGKKTILDEYYISEDKLMLLMLIKPMWDNNELNKTHDFVEHLRDTFKEFREDGIELREDYRDVGSGHVITYGFTGSYKTSLDDSYAIKESLEPVSLWAFAGIVGITVVFFRRAVPSLIVLTGMVLGTVLTMGFCRISVGQLNMITSILGGILMGFGVDYGIHFIFRTRIELAHHPKVDDAVAAAFVQAGRPACIAAVVTGGSFLVLMVSDFKGFSQFGFLAGAGTLIMGATMFVWCAAWVSLLGHLFPNKVVRLIGTKSLQKPMGQGAAAPLAAGRIPRPHMVLTLCCIVVAAICTLATSRVAEVGPVGDRSLRARLLGGVRFNYNSRSLMALSQTSIVLQDEINRRFHISSDPVAVYSRNLDEAKELYDELVGHKEKYSTIDQVMSIYTFVPNKEDAMANAAIMHAWHDELEGIDVNLLGDQERAGFIKLKHALLAEPFDVHHVPDIYASQFYHLPTTHEENRGVLTYLYPQVDLMDGTQMLRFADEVGTITTASGHVYHAAGSPLLFARLARTVLHDGQMTLILAAVWILMMHYLDFRSVVLAVASVLPLCLGLGMMLGLMALTAHPLNFMNIIMLPILLGFGVSHGLYLLHRFLEGVPAVTALRSVGAAVASSTLTAVAGFASLFAASHQGLQSMGYVACLGLCTTLVASFSVLACVLQLIDDRRQGNGLPLARTK